MNSGPVISIIVACAENLAIGKENRLLWSLPEDMKRFRQMTSGHVVIMGRKTFESIGRPLPNRRNIVITRQKREALPGSEWVDSLDAAISLARQTEKEEIFILGGAEIYRQALPIAERVHLTVVHAQIDGDAFFPAWPQEKGFLEVTRDRQEADERHAFACSFLKLERRSPQ